MGFSVYCQKLCPCLEGVDIWFEDIVAPIISLGADTCSVVDLFLRYTDWEMGIAEFNLKLTITNTLLIFL